jgi:hypothetical protein
VITLRFKVGDKVRIVKPRENIRDKLRNKNHVGIIKLIENIQILINDITDKSNNDCLNYHGVGNVINDYFYEDELKYCSINRRIK